MVHNVLTWTFNDINLPDSTSNEPESHGYIKFKVSPQADMVEGTQVENFADIFFDFNDPIRTNTTLTTFENYVFPTPDTPVDPCTFVSTAKVGEPVSTCETSINLSADTYSAGQGQWSIIQGGGEIQNPGGTTSLVTGLAVGENIFRWQISPDICEDNYQDLTITVKATPDQSSVENPEANILQSSVAGDSYQWYLNGELMQNQTSQSFEATESGDYQVEVVSNSCTAELSDVFTFEVTSLESELEEAYGFKINPNPTAGDLQLSLERLPHQPLTFELINLQGEVLFSVQSKGVRGQSWTNQWDISTLPNGTYLLKVQLEKGTFTKKIIKQ